MTEIMAAINRDLEHEESTKSHYRRVVKMFMLWYAERDPRVDAKNERERRIAKLLYDYLRREVKATYKRKGIDPSTFTTVEEFRRIAAACESPRDAAFLAIMFFGGLRHGEILNLCIKHLQFNELARNPREAFKFPSKN
jgi:integrase